MVENNEELQDEGEENEGSPSTVASKKKILLLLLPIFLVVGIVITLYFSGAADSFLTINGTEESKPVPKDEKQQDSSTLFYDVPELLINLSVKPGQKPIYVKIKVALEMGSPADVDQADKLLPRIIDSLQFYLREMRLEEIQGSAGSSVMKLVMTTNTNTHTTTSVRCVKDVKVE